MLLQASSQSPTLLVAMNCMYSSLVSPFKLKLHRHSLPFLNHFQRRPPLASSHLAAAKKQLKKVHCEFEPKVNGALSPDSDSRFLDRVTLFSLFCYPSKVLFSLLSGIASHFKGFCYLEQFFFVGFVFSLETKNYPMKSLKLYFNYGVWV